MGRHTLFCLAAAGTAHAWVHPAPDLGFLALGSRPTASGFRNFASHGVGRARRGLWIGAASLSASGSAAVEAGAPRVWEGGLSMKSGVVEASDAAMWHRLRRKAIIEAHPEAKELEGRDWRGGAMLLVANGIQLAVSFPDHCPRAWSLLHTRKARMDRMGQSTVQHDRAAPPLALSPQVLPLSQPCRRVACTHVACLESDLPPRAAPRRSLFCVPGSTGSSSVSWGAPSAEPCRSGSSPSCTM